MTDLISRTVAIDAIVSVTAFPDADYIKNLCENPSYSEDWLGGVCEAINAVEDVDAVDAVPISWLQKLMFYGELDIPKSAWRVLKAWRKERESTEAQG